MIQGWESPLERGLADLRELRSLLRCLKAGDIAILFQGKIFGSFSHLFSSGTGVWPMGSFRGG